LIPASYEPLEEAGIA